MSAFLTPWFPIGVLPVRDGVYLCRRLWGNKMSDSWFAMRWDVGTSTWYSAGSTGTDEFDVIGGSGTDCTAYQWRGLAADPSRGAA
jgi:hypothetical protein